LSNDEQAKRDYKMLRMVHTGSLECAQALNSINSFPMVDAVDILRFANIGAIEGA